MSAVLKKEKIVRDKRVFTYEQQVPIPSYLIALAVGQLDSRDISERVKVWAEPSMVDAVAYEFGQTEEFLQIAESLTSPYMWGRYDVLCLPPSFPVSFCAFPFARDSSVDPFTEPDDCVVSPSSMEAWRTRA